MYTDADTYTCPRCDEVKDNTNTYEAACTSCGVCGDCVPTSGGCGSSELCEECGGGDDDKETDTAHLYEDNAGGLTVEHQGVVYRIRERDEYLSLLSSLLLCPFQSFHVLPDLLLLLCELMSLRLCFHE